MRGFPLLNLLAALVICGAIILPLVHRATESTRKPQPAVAADTSDAGSNASALNTHVSLRFVHPPEKIVLSVNDQPLLTKAAPGFLTIEETIQLPITESRAEIHALITWPEGTPDTVVEVKLEPDGLASRSANIWSSGPSADELVTFSWREPAP